MFLVEVGAVEAPSSPFLLSTSTTDNLFIQEQNPMSTKKLICKNCDADFLYPTKEYNRQIKKFNRSDDDFLCSRNCTMSWRNKNWDDSIKKKRASTMSKVLIGNTRSKKGDFTYYLNKSFARDKQTNLSESYLSELWNSQKGKCALSKMSIHLKSGKHKLNTASLDRIDSSIGYVEGNVQFVSYGINLAKNSFSNDDMHHFINDIILSSTD